MKNMNSLRHVASLRIFATMLAASLLLASNAHAALVIQVWEVGGNVYTVSYGTANMAGVARVGGRYSGLSTAPSTGYFAVGPLTRPLPPVEDDVYYVTAPSTLGPGGTTAGTAGCGDRTSVSFATGRGSISLPGGYISNTRIGGSGYWAGKSFATLGLTVGTYNYSWAADTLTLYVGTTPVGAYWNAGNADYNSTSSWLSGAVPTTTAYLNNGSVISLTDARSLSDSFVIGQTCAGGTLSLAAGGNLTTPRIDLAYKPNTFGILEFNGGKVATPLIQFGHGSGAVNFKQTDALSLGSLITGPGTVRQQGAGTTTLTANNNYTGPTEVTGGRLLVNGTHTGGGTYTVGGTGTLGGTGRAAAAVVVNAGGTVAPGPVGAIGEFIIGSLTLNPSGALGIAVTNNATSLLRVTGAANLDGQIKFTSLAAPTGPLYPLLIAGTSLSGIFTSINNLPSGYEVFYGDANTVFLKKLVAPAFAVTPLLSSGDSLITGGTLPFAVSVVNSGATPLTFTSASGTNTTGSVGSTPVAAGDSTNAAGISWNGTTVGPNQSGSFTATSGATTTNVSVTGISVYDHAAPGVTGGSSLDFAPVHAGYSAALQSTNSLLVTNTNGFRVDLGMTNNNTGLVPTLAGLAQGSSSALFGSLATGRAAGQFTNTVQLRFFDDSSLRGVNTNLLTTNITVSGYVYSGEGVWTAGAGGNWTNISNWQIPGGVPGVDGALSINDTALFGTPGSGPVTLNTNAGLRVITFSNATSYVVSGSGTITLGAASGGNATISTLAGAHTISNAINAQSDLYLSNAASTGLTLAGGVSGASSGVNKSGAGTTTLSGNNTYGGATFIGSGTLAIGGSGVLGGGTYGAAITNNGVFLYESSSAQTLTGTISGSGSLVKNGSGALTINPTSNANTYTGGTTVNGGTLVLARARDINASVLGTNTVTVNAGATLISAFASPLGWDQDANTPNVVINGGVWDSGNWWASFRNLTLSNGIITRTGSMWYKNQPGVITASGNSLISGGGYALRQASVSSLPYNTFDVTSNSLLTVSSALVSDEVSSGFIKIGAGTMLLTSTNSTYRGTTTISNGVLQAGANGAMSSNSLIRVRGGSFDLNGKTNTVGGLVLHNATNNQASGSLTTLFSSGIPDESLQVGADAGNVGVFNLSGGSVEVRGNQHIGFRGTGIFNQTGGTNTQVGSYYFVLGRFAGATGTYNLSAGSMNQASAGYSIIGEEGTGVFNLSGTGVFSNAAAVRIGLAASGVGTLSLSNNGQFIAPGIIFGANTNNKVIFDLAYNTNYTGTISGGGALIKNGASTLTLSGNNSYTRGTTINGGTVIAAGLLANDANNAITVNNGGTFVFARNFGNTFGNHNATILTPIVINAGGLITNSGSTFFSSLGPITLNGGTLAAGTVGGPDGYSYALKGPVTVNSNSTISGPGISLGAGSVTGTTFNVASNATLTVTGGLTNGAGISWPKPQASSLTKTGTGTLLLNGTNTYTGDTTISGGTVAVGGSGVLGGGNYNGDIASSGTLIIDSTANQTLGGTLSGTGALVKNSAGTLTLDGLDNTYSGTTTINDGTLLLNVNHTGAGAYTVNGGTLGGSGTTTAGVTVKSGANITPGDGVNPGTLSVGSLTLSNGGVLNVALGGDTSSLLNVAGNLSLGGTVNFITNGLPPLTASLYNFVSYGGTRTGVFLTTNNLPTGYEMHYGDDDKTIFLKLQGVSYAVGAFFDGPNEVITGGALPFDVSVFNDDSNSVTFTAAGATNTAGTVAATTVGAGHDTNAAGLSWTGTTVGTNSGTFDVTFNGSSSYTTNVGLTVLVYDHASGSLLTNTLEMPDAIVGYTGALQGTLGVSNAVAAPLRAALGTTSSSTNAGLTVEDVADVDAGVSDNLTVSLAGQGAGVYTNNVNVTYRDSSTLRGASTNVGTTNFAVTGTIYNHASGSVAGSNVLNFAPVHVGYSGPLTSLNSVVISNAAGLRVALGSTAVSTNGDLSVDNVADLAQGSSTNISATLQGGADAGVFTNNVSVTFFDDSGLLGASTNVGTTNLVVTGIIYTGQGVWTSTNGGNWTTFTNWLAAGGTPGLDGALSVNDTATFGAAGRGPVTLNTNAALLGMTFSNTSSYILSGSGTITLASSGSQESSISSLRGTHTISNAIVAPTDLTLDVATNSGLVLNGVISGAGGLIKTGAGTSTLGAANTYEGTTAVSAGTLIGSAAGAFGTNAITVGAFDDENAALLVDVSAGGFSVSNAITVEPNIGVTTIGSSALGTSGWAKFTGPIELQNDVTLVAAAAFGSDTNSNRTDFSGGISGTGDVTISTATNSRVLFTTTANTFVGNVIISPNSTLQLSDGTPTSADFIPDTANVTVGSNGFLKLAKGNNNEWIAGLSGTGTVEAIAGGTNELVIGNTDASATFAGRLRDNGGVLDIIKIGQGTQTLTGTSTYSGKTYVDTGVLSVVGPGSVSGTREVWVYNKDSVLEITGGGSVASTGDVIVGVDNSHNDNQINVLGTGSTLSAADRLFVGNGGTNNQLNVSGGHVFANNFYVGQDAASLDSFATIADGGSLTVSNTFIVGVGGTKNGLQVLNGGMVAVTGPGDVVVGNSAGATRNFITLSGAGSTFSNHSAFVLGLDGASNSLVVEDGAELRTGNARIGRDAGSDGNAATVTGAGSTWDITGTLRVGSSGNSNSLEIADGGIVNVSSNVFVGYLGTSAVGNAIRVAGTDSQLIVTNGASQLVVGGNPNSNSVTVADGGELVVNSIQLGPQGFLRLGEGAGAGFISDTATINATNGGGIVEFNHTNDVYNFVAEMKGDLSVVFNGPGTTTIGGSNSYTGTTTINSGIVVTTTTNAFGNNSAVALNAGELSLDTGLNIGSLVWDAAALVRILDAVSDANNLDITGDLKLANGPTNMFDLRGTFVGGSPTKLLTAANMNNFDPSLFGIVGGLAGDYILTISNNALWIDAEMLIVDGSVTTTSGATNSYKGVRYVAGSDPNLEIPVGSTINITNNPVVMSNNSVTTVNGTFGATNGFTVEQGSQLSGAGTLIGNVVNGGLLAPGNPTGQMTIQGNFTQTPSGTTGLQIAGPNTFSQLLVTGTATLAGTLQVTPINGFALQFGSSYQFLTATGGISGSYDTIAMPSGYRGRFLTSDNNTKGSLLIAPQSYTQMAITPNQFNVAAALDNFISAGGDRGVVSAALDSLTAAEYPSAFEQMMPTPYASLPTMAFNTANALNSGMFQRLWVIRVNGKGFSAGGMNLAPMQAEMGGTDDMGVFAINPSKDTKWGTFVDGNGIFANGGDVNYLQNYRSQSGGVTTGASYKWNDNLATGVYVGYQGLQAQYNNGRTTDNAVRFGAFGTYDIDHFYINGLVGGAYHGYTINRNINFGGLDRTATGRPGAGEFDLALGTGYDFKAGDFTWGPFTTMQYTYLGVQGFNETGADSLNLDVSPYNTSSLLYTLGAQAGYNWKLSKNVLVTPTIFAGWQHEFLQNAYTINSSFNTGGPAAPFSYNTGTPARDNFYGGVGVTVGLGERWQATAIYSSFVGGQNQSSQNLYLGLGYKF